MLSCKPSPNRQDRKLDGAQEAELVEVAAQPRPGGTRTLQLLVIAGGAEGGGHRPRPARRSKNDLKPWLREQRFASRSRCVSRLCDGRRPRSGQMAVRREVCSSCASRGEQATDPRRGRRSCLAGSTETGGLRVRAERNGEPVATPAALRPDGDHPHEDRPARYPRWWTSSTKAEAVVLVMTT